MAESGRRFGDTVTHSWVKDGEHRFVQVNAALADALGRSPAGLVGTHDVEVFPEPVALGYRRDDAVAARYDRRVLFFERPVMSQVSGWITTKTLWRHRGLPAVSGIARPWSKENIHEALEVPGPVRPDETGVPSWVSWAQGSLNARFRERVLVRQLADEAGLNSDYFGRRFQEAVGVDVHGLVRKLRVAWCLEHLVAGSLPLSRLAHRAGFADQSHFTRSFKREVGIPPGAFRDRAEEAPT